MENQTQPSDRIDPGTFTPSTLETLEHLFRTVPPMELRENLLELYHSYLTHCDGNLPVNFDQISRNMYHLIHCLPDINLESND